MKWIIPVCWTVGSSIVIEADTFEDMVRIAESDDCPMPNESEYTGDFEAFPDDAEEYPDDDKVEVAI